MTEIPEHLLQRSRARRAALGLGGEAGESAAPAASTQAASSAPAGTPAAVAVAEKAPAAVKAPEPVPHYVEASKRRPRIPYWAMPVVAGLLVWAPIYVGTLDAPPSAHSPADDGEEVFVSICAGCHNAAGTGGVGRPLADGEVVLTFPDWRENVTFVANGSADLGEGEVYGDPARSGGPHAAGTFNGQRMPAFGAQLTEEELLSVVLYIRTAFGGEELEANELLEFIESGGTLADLAQ